MYDIVLMQRRRHVLEFSVVLALFGCAPAQRPLPPAAPVPPAAPSPHFEKTFGQIDVEGDGALAITYKSIKLKASIGPDGNWEITGPKAGHRTMLKQGDDFLFVTALELPVSNTTRTAACYLLEFDNGRNLFVAGDAPDPDGLREFVYKLRDDGTEIYAGFFERKSNVAEAALAKLIALIQPQNALLWQSGIGISAVNEQALRQALAVELYDGSLTFLASGNTIPF